MWSEFIENVLANFHCEKSIFDDSEKKISNL